MGHQIKNIENHLKVLKSRTNKLDESINELNDLLVNTRGKNHDINFQGEDINEQNLAKGVVGVLAKLGRVYDEKISRVLSDYLGARSMLAVVCKNYDSVKALETYCRKVEGHFDVIFLDKLPVYFGSLIVDDPQKRLDLSEPRLKSGEICPGFVGFAVNMIHIDPAYLVSLTPMGHSLRETLFFSLFSHLQVYKTRLDMFNAFSSITEGAISLDGGIIRSKATFTFGSRDEGNVRFATVNYSDIEKQIEELRWCRYGLLEKIKKEQEKQLCAEQEFISSLNLNSTNMRLRMIDRRS